VIVWGQPDNVIRSSPFGNNLHGFIGSLLCCRLPLVHPAGLQPRTPHLDDLECRMQVRTDLSCITVMAYPMIDDTLSVGHRRQFWFRSHHYHICSFSNNIFAEIGRCTTAPTWVPCPHWMVSNQASSHDIRMAMIYYAQLWEWWYRPLIDLRGLHSSQKAVLRQANHDLLQRQSHYQACFCTVHAHQPFPNLIRQPRRYPKLARSLLSIGSVT
jgi:hypothetical protein